MPDILVQAFIGIVVANLAALAMVVIRGLPPRNQRRGERCTCPCCRCGTL